MMKQAFPIDAATYQRHRIHTQERNWAETNCYVDVWIELLHALGHEPIAALPFTIAIDFEGDQWTFFKFPHCDLSELYSLDVQELALWRPLSNHLEEQLEQGHPVLVELDSYYLPDTVGTAYKNEHVKTTVAAIQIDTKAQRLGYFHGQGYYELADNDFVNALRVNGPAHPEVLPPYAEFVKQHFPDYVRGQDLVQKSTELLRKHLSNLPRTNPFERFRPRFESDLQWLMQEPLEIFHLYSFATLRQFGASYECAAVYLKWLRDHGVEGLQTAEEGFAELSTSARTIQFYLARAMSRKKPIDLSVIDKMAEIWTTATQSLIEISFASA